MTTLTETMAALQDISDAVRADNYRAYLNALAHARVIGCTDEQIKDAYSYMVRQGTQPRFSADGELNYQRSETNDIAGAGLYAIKIEARNIDGIGSGVTATKWLTINADKFRRIADILAEE